MVLVLVWIAADVESIIGSDHRRQGVRNMSDDMGSPGRAGDRPLFERFGDGDVSDLIRDYPLAWLCAPSAGAGAASLLPLLAETDAAGRLVRLIGHAARGNPLVAALTADPGALILFNGPHGYLSPNLVSDRRWVPTWNYAQLRIEARIVFEPDRADEALMRLTDFMEAGQPDPWRVGEAGDRYARMAGAIIAFRADVIRIEGRFKLGQDERPEVLRELLARHPDPDGALVRWMRRFNAGRI